MNTEVLYSIKSPYREPLEITGYRFGAGQKAVCVAGSMRGNEIQQMYVCARLVKKLKVLEERGRLVPDKEILVIPCMNAYSMNIGKRFWTVDNTDINRMFPGYGLGETTQRIADGIFKNLQGYEYGIQLASFYQPGRFLPHVKMMRTGFLDSRLMKRFGLPYAIVRTPRPYDTTTLNYNWQVWETKAFSLYADSTDRIDEASADTAVNAILRFLAESGMIKYAIHKGYQTEILREEQIAQTKAPCGGIFRSAVTVGAEVTEGQTLGEILDPLDAEVLAEITAPHDGIVYYQLDRPLVVEGAVLYKIILRKRK